MYIYIYQLLSVFTPIHSKGSINKNLGYPCLLQQVVKTTHRRLHLIRAYRDGRNKEMNLKLLTQNYLNKNWGKFMHLIQNKREQTHIPLFHYYFRFHFIQDDSSVTTSLMFLFAVLLPAVGCPFSRFLQAPLLGRLASSSPQQRASRCAFP